MNKEELLQIINSPTPVIVKFGVKTGCKFCDQFRPVFDAFAKDRTDCYIYEKETLKDEDEVMNLYGIVSYPTTVTFQNWKVINKAKGAVTDEVLLSLTKTMQNISDVELTRFKLKTSIDFQNKQLELFELQNTLFEVEKEFTRRQQERNGQPVDDFPLPTNTATTQPVEACESCQ